MWILKKKHAFITNRLSEDPCKNKSYYVSLLKKCNHVALSIFCDLDLQVKWLRQEKPKYLTTFPTNLEYLFNKGYIPKVEHIFTYGEPINREFQGDFESETGIRITDFYSATEAGIIAQQCEYKNYHINSDNYFVEILSNTKGNYYKIGKVIITIFSNKTLPLIRYDIGDYVFVDENDENKECKCGRKSNYFSSIIGRKINQLQSKIKGKIWINDVINYIRKIKNIKKFQIKQDKSGNIIINYVGQIGRNRDKLKEIKEKIEKITDNNVKIAQVKDIKREESGKFLLVVRKP